MDRLGRMSLMATPSNQMATILVGECYFGNGTCTFGRSDGTIFFVFSDSFVKSAIGLKKYKGVKYQTTAQSITGLIAAGSNGINHGE
jgi:hypothetical protein